MKTNFNHMGDVSPVAYIAKSKQRVKQYDDTVYLKNGDEFEVEIFNPTETKVSARIELNGKSIGPGIIVRPGERIFLDRYVLEAKKFLFETYKVDGDNKQVQKAIESNGDLVVRFHKEKSYVAPVNNYITLGNNSYTGKYDDIIHNNTYTNDVLKSQPSNGIIGGQVISTSCLYSCSSIPTIDCVGLSGDDVLGGKRMKMSKTLSVPETKEIETGRVEKGSHSDQTFKPDYASFETTHTWKSEWKILPESRKEVTSDDLVRYCSSCGRRKKAKEAYCPSCGNKF